MSIDGPAFYSATMFERSLDDKLTAAQAGGFPSIALWVSDLENARRGGMSDAAFRARIADRGLSVSGIDCLFGWAGGEQVPPDSPFSSTPAAMVEAAAALGAPAINLAHAFGTATDPDRAADTLASVCERAGDAGLQVTIEPIPWGGIPTPGAAMELIAASGARNAGLALDVWHFFRAGCSVADLAALPMDRIFAVQLCDAAATPGPDPWADTSDRRLPLAGELPVAAFVEALASRGFTGTWGIECPSREWVDLPAEEVGRRCGSAVRRAIALP